ncbi:MAG TPA: hypothetical protein VMS73_02260, partial [Anaerolineaceae bacterium]|nr:hypothetical protein [Anaerolineaceae bacterium]
MESLPPVGNEPGSEGAGLPPVQPSNQSKPTTATGSGSTERRSSSSGWIFGVVLILIGAAFFLQNFNLLQINNWWALFLLIPAIG